jgi:murein DD-endopeptidase MepM/ murein hydrolase activator NlpD
MTTSQHPQRSGQPIKLVTIAKSSSRHFPPTAVARICSSFSPAACLPLWCREGWYVDITHAGGIVTRYCHQLVQPYVHIGQHVNAGDVIGISGSSGHSSGPHVHFKVHLGITPRRQQPTRCLSWLPPAPRSAHPLNWRARDNSSRRNDSPIPRKVPPCQEQKPTLTPTTAPHPQPAPATGHDPAHGAGR